MRGRLAKPSRFYGLNDRLSRVIFRVRSLYLLVIYGCILMFELDSLLLFAKLLHLKFSFYFVLLD